jgi:hypothetical protein
MFDSGYITPWFYRGWLFIFSENYRYVIRKTWTTKPDWYKFFDIIGSIFMMIFEVSLITASYFIYG